MGHEEHRHEAPRSIRIFVVTASDTRGEAEDESGAFLKDAIARAGHALAGYRIVKDEPAEIRAALDEAARAGADAVVVNGGTGIAARDRTYEAVAALLEKRLDGFGVKTYSLPMKPTRGGMPISESRKIAIAKVRSGARLYIPG